MCSSTRTRTDAPGMRGLVKRQLRGVILICSSTPMRTGAPGMRELVKRQQREVILMCSSTCTRMAVHGMRTQYTVQHAAIMIFMMTWMCYGGPSTMAALTRSMSTPGKLSKSLNWLEPLPHHHHHRCLSRKLQSFNLPLLSLSYLFPLSLALSGYRTSYPHPRTRTQRRESAGCSG